MHITCGLVDEHIRVTSADYSKFVMQWTVGRNDIVFRGQYDNHEINVVLRGSENASISVGNIDAARSLPKVELFTLDEIRKTMFDEFEGADQPPA